MKIWIILEHEFQKISNNKYFQYNLHWYFSQYISQDESDISFLFSGLDNRNGTYASLAFISGVENKNPPTGCGITAFWKSDFLVFFWCQSVHLLTKTGTTSWISVSCHFVISTPATVWRQEMWNFVDNFNDFWEQVGDRQKAVLHGKSHSER